MGKSRQRKYPTLDSSLNIFRETIIIIFSITFWIYCFTALMAVGGSLLHINTNTVLLIRSVLNMEQDGMNNIFLMMGISLIFIFMFLTVSLIYQKKVRKV